MLVPSHAISGNGVDDKGGNDEKVSGQITRGILGFCATGSCAKVLRWA